MRMRGKKYWEENEKVQKRVQESKEMIVAIVLSGFLLIVLLCWRVAAIIVKGLYHGHF